jgi:PAS domain S-box-containing protein
MNKPSTRSLAAVTRVQEEHTIPMRLTKVDRLDVGAPAAASTQGMVDRQKLALIAVERTRMPMLVTDPDQPDNPIILANQAFLQLTGYAAEEVIGRNCRFLQGPGTDPQRVSEIREAIRAQAELTVELLNYRKDGSPFWNELLISPVHDEDGKLLYFFASQKDITKRRQARELEAEEFRLLREVDHRAKNALALVQGIVRLSQSENAQAYASAVQARVEALARAHALLSSARWRSVPVTRLLEAEVKPFGSKRVALEGPELELDAEQVQPLALVLHEMFTNAHQHGALSAAGGTVTIRWERAGEKLVLEWTERGGPPPAEHRVPKFGSQLIGATIERQLVGRALFDWKSTGLESRLELPLARAKESITRSD